MFKRQRRRRLKIAAQTTEYRDPTDVLRGFERRAARERPLGLLIAEAQRRGYRPRTRPEDVLGFTQTFRASEDIQPPKGSREAPVRDFSFELSVQSFSKPRARDQAAVATFTLTAGSNTRTQHVLLEAPEGDFARAREFEVREEDETIARTRSYWSAVGNCMEVRGGRTCILSFIGCVPVGIFFTWVAYIGCIIGVCALAFIDCCVCAGCNCRWWCAWGTGCCKQ